MIVWWLAYIVADFRRVVMSSLSDFGPLSTAICRESRIRGFFLVLGHRYDGRFGKLTRPQWRAVRAGVNSGARFV